MPPNSSRSPLPVLAKPSVAPDAILCPRSFPVPPEHSQRAIYHKQIFAPIFGESRVNTRQCGAHHSLVTRFSEPERNHRYWPKGHENEGQEFYRWEKSSVDGVFFGYLTDEAKNHIEEMKRNPDVLTEAPDDDPNGETR